MRHDASKNRLKLLISLAVLAVVFVVAGIAQFTGKRWTASRDPISVTRSPATQPQARAVFGDLMQESKPALPIPAQVPQPEEPQKEETLRARSTPGNAVSSASIDGLLDRWRNTVVRGDVKAQAILYAPKMEQFFRRRNVTRDVVLREKARMKELYPNVSRYDITDVQVESHKENVAVVSFRKEWDMHGERRFSGSDRQRFKLRKIAGDWKIVGEEEMVVYWVRRG